MLPVGCHRACSSNSALDQSWIQHPTFSAPTSTQPPCCQSQQTPPDQNHRTSFTDTSNKWV